MAGTFSPVLGAVTSDTLQRSVERAFADLSYRRINDGTLIEDVTIPVNSSENTLVSHSLGRPVDGYIVVRRNNDAMVFDGTGLVKNPREEFSVKASSQASPAPTEIKVSFWVF